MLNDQIELTRVLLRLSPAANFALASSELAQTGAGLFTNFGQSYERFQREVKEYGTAIEEKRTNGELAADWLESGPAPVLHLPKVGLRETLSIVSVDLLLLAVYAVLFFLLSYLFFLRYDVT